jgi:hypothetical protein
LDLHVLVCLHGLEPPFPHISPCPWSCTSHTSPWPWTSTFSYVYMALDLHFLIYHHVLGPRLSRKFAWPWTSTSSYISMALDLHFSYVSVALDLDFLLRLRSLRPRFSHTSP